MRDTGNRERKGNHIGQAIKHTTFYYAKRVLFSDILMTMLLLVAQIALLALMFAWVSRYAHLFFEGSTLLAVIVLIAIINNDSNPSYKIAWIIPIALFPIGGSLLYLYVKYNIGTILPKKVQKQVFLESRSLVTQETAVKEAIYEEHSDLEKLSDYLERIGGYPTYAHSSMEYYPLGEDVMEAILTELKEAKEFIFVEFFMMEEGIFFNSVLDILEQKAAQGVEVRLMYDDFGCLVLLPRKYPETLRKKGIDVRVNARLKPFLSTHYNNRDHRKILVIDGKTAFTGGFNLCDEYINAYEKYGHWKDNGVMVKGNAVQEFTLMFLQTWNSIEYQQDFEYCKYLKTYPVVGNGGFMIPYGDGPHRDEPVAENVYKDILNNAKDYVYIMTPYLILDDEMEKTIMHAAMGGIDVRIILPHIPDKKIAFSIARTYYPNLLRAGVKIYEYEPGFIHAKTFLSDDKTAVVGTINLDFRSLYLHYECGVLFYRNEKLADIKKDFTDTFQKCIQVDIDYYRSISVVKRFFGRIWRIFGPLM